MTARLVVITESQPYGGPRECTVEHAGQNVLSAVVDFAAALRAARSHREASRIYGVLHQCVGALAVLESAALDRADALNCEPTDLPRGA